MKPPIKQLAAVAAVLVLIFGTAGLGNAQRRNERQIRDLVRSLNAQIDDFQYGLDYQLKSTSTPRQMVDDVHQSIRNLQTKVDDLEENLNNQKDNRDDVYGIIQAAKDVDALLAANPQNQRIDTNWNAVRATINSLASIRLIPITRTIRTGRRSRRQREMETDERARQRPHNREAL